MHAIAGKDEKDRPTLTLTATTARDGYRLGWLDSELQALGVEPQTDPPDFVSDAGSMALRIPLRDELRKASEGEENQP